MHLQVPRTRPLPEGGTIYQQPRLRPLPVLQSCKSISCVLLFERIGWKGNYWDGWDGDGGGSGMNGWLELSWTRVYCGTEEEIEEWKQMMVL